MLKDQIDQEKLPKHIAMIMDGNGRWAQERGMNRIFGHHKGVETVRQMVEACTEIGIKYLTLYAFSTENWNRPAVEVNALMELLVSTLRGEVQKLHENKVRIHTIGNTIDLPEKCQIELKEAKDITANNEGLNLVLALSYSSRWDIETALKEISNKIKNNTIELEDINQELISNHLTTKNLPEPELLIRTSGEHRISNFLLWELAYTELYFSSVHWPDFSKENFYQAILDYQKRERRFGKTSQQLSDEL